jgi:diketogulonate reductase-like aldo/keto reductase
MVNPSWKCKNFDALYPCIDTSCSGRAVKELKIRRSDLVLSTKVFWGQGESPNSSGLSRKQYVIALRKSTLSYRFACSIIEALDASLERLGMTYVDVYFAHRQDPTVPMEEVSLSHMCYSFIWYRCRQFPRLFVLSTGASSKERHTTGGPRNGQHLRLKKPITYALSLVS